MLCFLTVSLFINIFYFFVFLFFLKKSKINADSMRKTNNFKNNILKVEHVEKIKIKIFLRRY
jgi:phosphotransferase system  glucose/maltose/N-acetylglucosamine-specific IIC component